MLMVFFNYSGKTADVSGRGARDEALRTSALEANHRHDANKETLKIRGVDFSSASVCITGPRCFSNLPKIFRD